MYRPSNHLASSSPFLSQLWINSRLRSGRRLQYLGEHLNYSQPSLPLLTLVNRTITALTFAQSVLVYSGLLSGYYAVFLPGRIFKLLPEIWRVATPFLLTGPNLSFFFDLYFCMISLVLHWRPVAQMLTASSVPLWHFAGDQLRSVQPTG